MSEREEGVREEEKERRVGGRGEGVSEREEGVGEEEKEREE